MHQNAKCICRYQDDCLPAVAAQLMLSQSLFAPSKDLPVQFANITVYFLIKLQLCKCVHLSAHTLTMAQPS